MSAQLKLPLVSIVITSYNYAKYITDALKSVSLQTYRPLECIVVDDCSTDNSLEVIHKTISTLEVQNNGIHYSVVSTGKNSGQLAAFQQGIAQSKGVFINFLDADDFLFPDFISVHVQAHLENMVAFTFTEPIEIDDKNQIHSFHSNANSGFAYGDLISEKETAEFLSSDAFHKDVDSYLHSRNSRMKKYRVLSRDNTNWTNWYWYPTSTALFRRQTLLNLCHEQATDNWRICADYLLFCYAHIIGDSAFVPACLSAYRRHGNNGFTGDVMVGRYRYLPEKSNQYGFVLNNIQLPLSLIKLFSSIKEEQPRVSNELMQTLLYQLGPGFLIRHRKTVFACYPEKTCIQRLKLLFKTIIRHLQYKRKDKTLCLK